MSERLGSYCSAGWTIQSASAGVVVDRLLRVLRGLVVFALLCGSIVPQLWGQTPTPVDVPTWRYDLTHAGQNTNETELSPSNVNGSTFGKLFSLPVDGPMYAQPLYMSGLNMVDGSVHNVVFAETEQDSIYAFDADSNTGANANPIWHITLLDAAHGAGAGATPVPWQDTGSHDIMPNVGITGTPAINPATNTMYVVGATKENGAYFLRLHAINILTGAEQSHSPVVIQATVAGTGSGSSGGKLSFDPLWENQRVAVDYYNGHVYFAFSAHGDFGPWHGWVFAYDATTLAQTAAVCLSPDGTGNGVWQSGAGMTIDDGGTAGRMFLAAGNGTYASYPPYNSSDDFGDSVVAFDLANGGLTANDAFTPFNQAHLSSSDLDQGSGGILMLPDQAGAHSHILVQVGKEGRILVLDRDNLGGYATGVTYNTNALQDITGQTAGLWSTPAYWNGNVYLWGDSDVPKMFSIDNGVLSTTPTNVAKISPSLRGGTFSISSDGTQNGIAWAVRTDMYPAHGPEVLYAFDATNLSNMLYASSTDATQDAGGPAMKFATPVVTNGKVYIVALGQLDVYGLFHGQPTAAAPVIAPNGGSFSTAQSVKLSTTTSSANIYYTLNNTLPTTASTLYTGAFSLDTNTTVRAIASASGFVQSPESDATFTFQTQTPTVSFSPGGGTYTSAQNVTLADTDSAAVIYYTTNGTTPTASSNRYTTPIAVTSSTTIEAIALDPNLQNSNVATAAYVIQEGGSGINFGSGFASAAGLTLNGVTVNTNNLMELTNGGKYEAASFFWNQPIGVQSFTTDFTFQLSSAMADGFTFTIQNAGANALGGSSAGLGYASMAKSVALKFDLYNNAGEGTDSTGVYTDGAQPTVPAVDMTASGVVLRSGDTMLAHVTYDGTTLAMLLTDLVTNKSFNFSRAVNIPQVVGGNSAFVGFTGGTGGYSSTQKILKWTYATQAPTPTTAAPTFSPAGGSYSTAQSVTLADSTSGATIYYTTNGTPPTTGSSVYSGAIAVGTGTTTIEALAVASGSSPSAVVTEQYVVGAAGTAAPTFSPGSGTYSTAQNVTLTDSTSGAVIYYTTNGTTPTTGSAVYSSAIPVAATETLEAIAVANGQTSSVATAVYTIQSGASTINFGSGFASAAGLALNGSTVNTNNLMQLTNAASAANRGSVWFTTPVNIGSFTTDFNFQLLNAKADGFTFAIQNAGLSALGPAGSGLGYGASQPGGTGGIARSVAVKFDIYNNDGEGADSTGFYIDGASPTIPATNMSASGVILSSGHVLHAHIAYDGTKLTLVLTDTVTSASFTTSAAINIPSTVGATTAYVGFTGAFGGLKMTSDILNWTLTNP